jgi:hypothetical protein
MFPVPFGEHSPRVTLLQILLNSHECFGADGSRLVVDGVYGRNTKAAVLSAYGLFGLGIGQDGMVATSELVKQLLTDVDYGVITSVDLGDPALQEDIDVFIENGDDPIVLGGMCNGLMQLVSSVLTRARDGRIAAFRLDGHGNLGRWLTISVGNVAHLKGQAYDEIASEEMSYISSSNFQKVAGVIKPLKAIFAPFGFVEHTGCTLGARPLTRAMLEKLADLWGVPIRVGVQTQPVGGVMSIRGPVFTAFPQRHNLHSWSRQFQKLELPGLSRAG